MANKDQVVAKMQSLLSEIERTVSDLPADAWGGGVYERGWDAWQLLAHMASTSGTAAFLLGMARTTSTPTLDGAYDENAFNAQQVAAREGKGAADLVDEIRRNLQLGMDAVRNAPDDLITKHFRAPWGVEGEVGDVIVMSLEGHLGMHLADLRSTAG